MGRTNRGSAGHLHGAALRSAQCRWLKVKACTVQDRKLHCATATKLVEGEDLHYASQDSHYANQDLHSANPKVALCKLQCTSLNLEWA